MTMAQKTALAALTVLVIAPAAAFAAPSVGDELGTSIAEIAASLHEAGYDIREIERDDDEFEVEVILDGQRYELEISPTTGLITDLHLED